jgi:hypothetical protein
MQIVSVDVMNKTLINICGTARSGSTMVDLMLGNDSCAFSLGEVYAWFRPFRSHHFKIICSCGKDDCPWKKIQALKECEFHEKCFNILNIDVLVDSSKDLPWVIDNNIWASKNNITVYNILLFKQPINFFYSFWKRGVSFDNAKKSYIKYYKRFFQSGIKFIALDYNKLVADPANVLENLCILMEIPYFEGKERFWEKEHHHIFGSRGTRKQVEKADSKIRKQEDYPKNFKEIISGIQLSIEKDKVFQHILSMLSIYEMSEFNSFSEKNTRKQLWYYLSKIMQNYYYYFPEKWIYEQ